jgi:hypothetical protein
VLKMPRVVRRSGEGVSVMSMSGVMNRSIGIAVVVGEGCRVASVTSVSGVVAVGVAVGNG